MLSALCKPDTRSETRRIARVEVRRFKVAERQAKALKVALNTSCSLRAEGPQHGFARFWITDSCPQTVRAVKGRAPFEILSLAGPIAAALHI
jgi:hypothetical protein